MGTKKVNKVNVAANKTPQPNMVAVPNHFFHVLKKGRGRQAWMRKFIPRTHPVFSVDERYCQGLGLRLLFPDLPDGPLGFIVDFHTEQGLVIRDEMLFGELLEDTQRLMSLGTTTCYRDMVEPHLH